MENNDLVYFAYDGSLNGDWVFRYALRIAKNLRNTSLIIIHVLDEKIPGDRLSDKFNFMQTECKKNKIKFQSSIVPKIKNSISLTIHNTITSQLPEDAQTLVICGARGRGKGRGYLRNTVSEQLLAIKNSPAHIMVVRVVQPGLLGQAADILMPISGRPLALDRALHFLEYLKKPLQSLHLLHVTRKPGLTTGLIWHSEKKFKEKQTTARHYLRDVARVIKKYINDPNIKVDWRSVTAINPLREIMVQSTHLKSQIILMGIPAISHHHQIFRRLLPSNRAWNDLEEFLRQTSCDIIFYQERK